MDRYFKTDKTPNSTRLSPWMLPYPIPTPVSLYLLWSWIALSGSIPRRSYSFLMHRLDSLCLTKLRVLRDRLLPPIPSKSHNNSYNIQSISVLMCVCASVFCRKIFLCKLRNCDALKSVCRPSTVSWSLSLRLWSMGDQSATNLKYMHVIS